MFCNIPDHSTTYFDKFWPKVLQTHLDWNWLNQSVYKSISVYGGVFFKAADFGRPSGIWTIFDTFLRVFRFFQFGNHMKLIFRFHHDNLLIFARRSHPQELRLLFLSLRIEFSKVDQNPTFWPFYAIFFTIPSPMALLLWKKLPHI